MSEVTQAVELKIDVSEDDPPFEAVPAPWILKGRGLVMLHDRPAPALLERWVPESLQARYVGGPAAVMLVDYASSPVGPYHELLFIPGRFRLDGRILPVITRIVVSTWASVANGRMNWAIPKELAHFEVARHERMQRWTVRQDDALLLDVASYSLGPRIPVTTRLLPAAWATVAQPRKGRLVLTHLASSGRSGLARIDQATYGERDFPDLGFRPPRLSLVIDPFRMVFPEAEIR